MKSVFKRKLYNKLLEWKTERRGQTAILVEGARRVGKSTLVESFAKNEYESYLIIDFNKASDAIKNLFNDLMDMDYLFLYLQTAYHVTYCRQDFGIRLRSTQLPCPRPDF